MLVFNTASCIWIIGMFSKALLFYCPQFEIETVIPSKLTGIAHSV
jgi:hypothetical protein